MRQARGTGRVVHTPPPPGRRLAGSVGHGRASGMSGAGACEADRPGVIEERIPKAGPI